MQVQIPKQNPAATTIFFATLNIPIGHMAAAILKYCGSDLRKMRIKLNLSQRAMAAAVGVSPRTVEAWERGVNVPGGTVRYLLYLFDKQPQLVDHLVERK